MKGNLRNKITSKFNAIGSTVKRFKIAEFFSRKNRKDKPAELPAKTRTHSYRGKIRKKTHNRPYKTLSRSYFGNFRPVR